MTDKEKYDFIDYIVHLTLLEEDRLLNEHGGEYSGLEEDGIDSNEYYRIITERVINILKKNNNYMQEEPVSEYLEEVANSCSSCTYLEEVLSDDDKEILKERLINTFKAGANWQKEKLMASGIDVIVHIDAGNCPYIPEIELYDYDKDIPLAKEGDKYRVILIK